MEILNSSNTLFEYKGTKYTYDELAEFAKEFGYDTDTYITGLAKQGLKQIKAEESDKLVRSFSMYLHKFITKKVKEVDDKARDKAKHFCEKNKDFWIKGD